MSPRLLQLSGIGPAEVLEEQGVEVMHACIVGLPDGQSAQVRTGMPLRYVCNFRWAPAILELIISPVRPGECDFLGSMLGGARSSAPGQRWGSS